jgi:hypothetical protein
MDDLAFADSEGGAGCVILQKAGLNLRYGIWLSITVWKHLPSSDEEGWTMHPADDEDTVVALIQMLIHLLEQKLFMLGTQPIDQPVLIYALCLFNLIKSNLKP